ncbi:MAG TPA: pyrroline-5-carboxylate reductase [Limnochordia bacterium]|nr:pyrroline-5-carboxylate reductase [Limnochordia bacterium]
MERRIGFIGAGMMAEALIAGVLGSGLVTAERLIASDVSEARREAVAKKHHIRVTHDNRQVVTFADVLVLAVKPQHAADVLGEIGGQLDAGKTVVSIMAGVSTATIESFLPAGVPVVRVMPNLPCVVGAGAAAVCQGRHATREHAQEAAAILEATGRVVFVDEALMDAVTGLSGSGPAYVLTVIESLADGGVAEGLPRAVALELAAQTVLGAAKLMLETGEHPAVLRDRVISPAGTTAEGMGVLETSGVRGALREAVRQAARRSRQLGEGTS